MSSARLELLRPLITPAIEKLARTRVLTSENLFSGERLVVKMKPADVKIALLLAEIINPYEDFSAEEEALMRGISSKTLRARKANDSLARKNRLQ